MTRDGIEKIQEMTATGIHKAENGREIAFGNWSYIEPYEPKPIYTKTLAGFCDCVDTLFRDTTDIVITEAFKVICLGKPDAITKKRPQLCIAKTDTESVDTMLRNSYELSDFFKVFKRNFYFEVANAPSLLEFMSNISQEHLTELRDNGISQQVVVKNGITSLVHKSIGDSIELKPKCMFAEVDMTLPYFVRMDRDGRVSLSPAYGEIELAQVAAETQAFIQEKTGCIVVV